MKTLLPFLTILLFACNNPQPETSNTPKTDTSESETDQTVVKPPEGEINNPLLGSYVGMFDAEEYDIDKAPSWSNKINISIDKIMEDSVIGHSVVAGNDRPFSGTLRANRDGSAFTIIASEPGDDKYDGSFTFSVDAEGQTATGFWIANDPNLAVTKRTYTLEKRTFKYEPSLVLENIDFLDLYGTYNESTGESEIVTAQAAAKNPSVDILTKEDVENMKRGDLEVMRNTIYARHGYSFKNRKMRYVFNYVDWYFPVSTDIRAQLTDLEKQNIDLIKRYEQHAERYYDSFGR